MSTTIIEQWHTSIRQTIKDRRMTHGGSNAMDPPLCKVASQSQNDVRDVGNHSRAQEASPRPQVSVLGIDLAKQMFPVVGLDDAGNGVLRKRCPRGALLPFMAQRPPVVIGMEACGGAHDGARRFREHGPVVTLMAPQFVKP
jgi:hypothetical protein